MAMITEKLQTFLNAPEMVALVEVTSARGSTPRDAGAYMLVSSNATLGTIGGGQLEFMAIDRARQMLVDGQAEEATLDVPLGPEIGQCCGGRVEVLIRRVDGRLSDDLIRDAQAEATRMPEVYLFGGGHVGLALANALSLLPLRTTVVETRADALQGMPAGVATTLTPVPEETVRSAGAGAAFVVLTHDHALDFLIVAEALKRKDAAYVGMIGSKTKKATFKSWYLKEAGGNEADFARLVSPIAGDVLKDKRPAVIAALAAAEIMTAVAARTDTRKKSARI